MEQEIMDFISEHHVASVACCEENIPYCFNCFYSFIKEGALLVYKSSFNTRHEQILEKHKNVAGTIVPEQVEVATIKGVQFQGVLLNDGIELAMKASASYYSRFPFAMAVPGKIQVIELQHVKFTDNTRGFGFKQHWSK